MKSGLEKQVANELSSGGRVLVSRLQYLGDVILTLPLIRAIKQAYPEAAVDYLSRADGAAVLDGDAAVDRVLRVPEKSDGAMETLRLIAGLRRGKYAAAIDLYSNPRSALLIWLSGARMRIGGDRRGRRRFYTHPISVPKSVRSAIDHHLRHLVPLGITHVHPEKPALSFSMKEKGAARERLIEAGVEGGGGPLIGLHPGGKWVVKRWPLDRFVELGKSLAARRGCRLVVFAGPGEDAYRDELAEALRGAAVRLTTYPIRETAAIVGELDGLVVSDGGIMHVSVAAGTPTVGVFGSAEPDIWFPYEKYGPYRAAIVPIDCRPCHSHECDHISCLRGVTPEMVEDLLFDALSQAAEGENR